MRCCLLNSSDFLALLAKILPGSILKKMLCLTFQRFKSTCSECASQAVYSTFGIMKSMKFCGALRPAWPSPVYCLEREGITSHRPALSSFPHVCSQMFYVWAWEVGPQSILMWGEMEDFSVIFDRHDLIYIWRGKYKGCAILTCFSAPRSFFTKDTVAWDTQKIFWFVSLKKLLFAYLLLYELLAKVVSILLMID